jgi:hypothetical protein
VQGHRKRGWKPIVEILEADAIQVRAARAIATIPSELRDLIAPEVLAAAEADVSAKVATAERELEGLRSAKLYAATEEAKAIIQDAERQAETRLGLVERAARRKMGELLEAAHLDAVETMADEALISKLARKNVMVALQVSTELNQDLKELQKVVKAQLALGNIPLAVAMNSISAIAAVNRHHSRTAQIVLELERLRLGQPTEIVEVTGDVSSEEVEAEARLLVESRDRIRAKQAAEEAARNPPPEPDATAQEAPVSAQTLN